MIKNLALLALLASSSLAAPTARGLNSRTPEALDIGLGLNVDVSLSISASVGFSADIAVALEACVAGVASGLIVVEAKVALAAWIQGSGAHYFEPSVCQEITSWCNGDSDYELPGPISIALGVALEVDAAISAAGGSLSYLNSYIEKNHNGSSCACSAIPDSPRTALLAFVKTSVGAALDIDILGALQLCASGGIAASLSASVQASLSAWLELSTSPLDADLVVLVKAWLSVGTGITSPSTPYTPSTLSVPSTPYTSSLPSVPSVPSVPSAPLTPYTPSSPSVPSVPSLPSTPSASSVPYTPSTPSSNPSYILTGQTQADLLAWIDASVFATLDVSVQAALRVCASGGIAASLDAAALAALTAYVSNANCALPAALHVTIQLWLEVKAGVGLVVGTAIDAFAYINIGVLIEASVDVAGHLATGSSTSVSEFAANHTQGLPDYVHDCLQHAAEGGLAAELEVEAAIALAAYLADEACQLDATVRATLLVWLSISGLKAVTLSADVVVAVKAAIDAALAVELSSVVRGALGLAINGEVATVLSVAARAELAAFLLVDVKVGGVLDVGVVADVLGWLAGVGISL